LPIAGVLVRKSPGAKGKKNRGVEGVKAKISARSTPSAQPYGRLKGSGAEDAEIESTPSSPQKHSFLLGGRGEIRLAFPCRRGEHR